MKLFRNFSLLLFILLVGLYTKATTVTGTLLDPSFQVLSNAAVRVEFTPFPGSNGNPNINAILFSTDNLGAFSITLTPNVSINPSKSTYTFTICPNATVRCSVVRGVTITSLTTQDISTQLNTGIDTINVDPTTLVPKAYNDAELRVIDLTNTGAIYWNVLAKTLRIWDGSTWGQIPSTTNSDFLKLNGWTYTTGTFSDIQSAINYVSSQGGGRLINNIITPYTGPGFTVASGVEFDFAKTDYNPSSSIICVTGSSCIGRSTWVNNGTRIFVPNNFNDDMVKNEYDYGIIGTGGIVRAANIVTATTLKPHGRSVGDIVVIAGPWHDRNNNVIADASFFGTFTIATVPSSTTFTYTQTGANATSGFMHVYGAITGAQTWHSANVEGIYVEGNQANNTYGDCFNLPSLGETTKVDRIFANHCAEDGIVTAGSAVGSPKITRSSSMRSTRYGYSCEYCSNPGISIEASGDSNGQALGYVCGRTGSGITLNNLKGESVTADDGLQNVTWVLDGETTATPIFNVTGRSYILGPSTGTLKDDAFKILNGQWRLSLTPSPYIFGYTNGINDLTTYQGAAAGVATTAEVSLRPAIYWNSNSPTTSIAILRGDFVIGGFNTSKIRTRDASGNLFDLITFDATTNNPTFKGAYTINNGDLSSSLLTLNAGTTASQLGTVTWSDRGTAKWQWQKTVGNNFVLNDVADASRTRLVFQTASITNLNSGGTQPVQINNNTSAGTAGLEVWNGGTTPALTGTIKGGVFTATNYLTATNCSSNTSPSTCTSSPAGAVVIAAAATSIVVNTTAVTVNSDIEVQEDSSMGTRLGVTCNTTLGRTYVITAKTAGTSFTITSSAAPVTNPACLTFRMVN